MAKKTLNNTAEATAAELIAKTPEEREEDAERLNTGQTRGKKGLKLPRLNTTFSEENYNYMRTMAALRGESMTSFLNDLIKKDREANAAQYEKAKAIIDELKE